MLSPSWWHRFAASLLHAIRSIETHLGEKRNGTVVCAENLVRVDLVQNCITMDTTVALPFLFLNLLALPFKSIDQPGGVKLRMLRFDSRSLCFSTNCTVGSSSPISPGLPATHSALLF